MSIAPFRKAAALAALASFLVFGPATAGSAGRAAHEGLARPDSLRVLQAHAARDGRPVVALFSTAGCGWCEALRREQLAHLAREAGARGVLVVEFDLADQRRFAAAAGAQAAPARQGGPGVAGSADGWSRAESPAALARQLGVRVAPTVAFLGPQGVVAEPLVGYGSPDFYGAYLDERIVQARAAAGAPGSAAARRAP